MVRFVLVKLNPLRPGSHFKYPARLRQRPESRGYTRGVIQCLYTRKFSIKNDFFFMNLHHLASQRGWMEWVMLLGERTVDHGSITRQSVLALLRSRSNVCCSGLPLHSSTSKMTYKRKITIVRLRNLKRSRRGTSSSQQPVNVTLEGLTSDTSGRTALGGRHDPSPPTPSPPPPPPPPPPQSLLVLLQHF